MNSSEAPFQSQKQLEAPISVSRRSVGRSRSLPSGRAALGALLVTLAGIGFYLASVRATSVPTTPYVVVVRDLSPGHRLTSNDLKVVNLRLESALIARTFTDKAALVGARTLGPIGGGELLQQSNIIQNAQGAAGREMSFSIDTARALDGQLRPGERVDVVATADADGGPKTTIVIGAALVIRVSGDGLTGTGERIVVVLALRNTEEELSLAQAVNEANIILVRANGNEPIVQP